MPLEPGQIGFGFPLAARTPRQIQFALKFCFRLQRERLNEWKMGNGGG
jgi:hypothetical protein